jgi:hypothetical protein
LADPQRPVTRAHGVGIRTTSEAIATKREAGSGSALADPLVDPL